MKHSGIHIEKIPEQIHPIMITGFDGWGNAMDVSTYMVSYLIRRLNGKRFAQIDPEVYFRYDEYRPEVKIQRGILKSVTPPGGIFYSAETGLNEDRIIILKTAEPSLRWRQFVEEVLSLCRRTGVKTIINLGSMYDDVLHSDRMISGIASSEVLLSQLKARKIRPINYDGPGGIHSFLHSKAQDEGLGCMSLWCHCPYYLQGTTHFGLLTHLGALLSDMGGFELDLKELDTGWKQMNKQIKLLIDENQELRAMVEGLRKARTRRPVKDASFNERNHGKIIQLKDFLEPQ